MTFNATFLPLLEAVERGALAARAPFNGLPVKRGLYLPANIADLIDGETHVPGFPAIEAISVTDRFMVGYLVYASLTAETNTKCILDLERLEDADEVWVMCFRKPKPGWRVMGRFTEKNCFVGLKAFDRNHLGKKANYTAEAEKIPQAWTDLFGNADPFKADTVEEYLDQPVRDVTVNAQAL